MSPTTILVFCAQALLAQSAFSACAGSCGGCGGYKGGYSAGLSGGYGSGYGCGASGVTSNGGSLPISSASSIAPTGISVVSENVLEGELIASGNLPFLAAVALEGKVPSGGKGAVSYGCGDSTTYINEASVGTGSGHSYARSAGVGYAGYGQGRGAGCGYASNAGRGSSCGCGGRY